MTTKAVSADRHSNVSDTGIQDQLANCSYPTLCKQL